MKNIYSISFGKDSLAMLLKAMEEGLPIDYVVFFDTGMEYKSVIANMERARTLIRDYGAELVVLRPDTHFLYDMLLKPIRYRDGSGTHYGYDWCGGCCRWRTSDKIKIINSWLNSLNDDYTQFIGIAADEPDRIKYENSKRYPLVEWGMTEHDCLNYCYSKGWSWDENGVELYSILDRVSCWCCKNKNLKELRNMYHYLPEYWQGLKALQSRIPRPFYHDKTVFELEQRFEHEGRQLEFFSCFSDIA